MNTFVGSKLGCFLSTCDVTLRRPSVVTQRNAWATLTTACLVERLLLLCMVLCWTAAMAIARVWAELERRLRKNARSETERLAQGGEQMRARLSCIHTSRRQLPPGIIKHSPTSSTGTSHSDEGGDRQRAPCYTARSWEYFYSSKQIEIGNNDISS